MVSTVVKTMIEVEIHNESLKKKKKQMPIKLVTMLVSSQWLEFHSSMLQGEVSNQLSVLV